MPVHPHPSRRAQRPIGAVLAATLALVVLLPACSDGGGSARPAVAHATTTTSSAARAKRTDSSRCDLGAGRTTPPSTPVPGVASDLTLTSFDGTEIRIHWFPATPGAGGSPAPTILMGPGWSLAGDTSRSGGALFGALGIGQMNDAGYNVLTWDPRGFGASTGVATVNDPAHEGKDAQALLDWVASRPEAELDGPGDPRAGMVGWSYGGGIQLTLAGIDCRVDAIVPGLAWHSLETSLYKARTVKTGWAGVLTSAAAAGHLDPHILSAHASGDATGTLSPTDERWFVDRGPGDLVGRIRVPTLLVQGTVDTLFTLDEAITNDRILRRHGVPSAMLWFCGGHGSCLTDAGDPGRVARATLAWLDRYLRGDRSAQVGPGLDLVDQDGRRWVADRYPDDGGAPTVQATGSGTLELQADSEPAPFPTAGGDLLTGLVSDITPTPAGRAVEVRIDPRRDGLVLGAPRLHLDYAGTAPEGPRPARIFAQLVDLDRHVVVGNQVTPVPLVLDGKHHQVDADLEVVAQHVTAGHSLVLQLVATTDAYATPRLGGSVDLTRIRIALPLPAGVRPG